MATRVLRFFIGAILLATAAGKLVDVRGFAEVLGTYEALPPSALLPIAAAVPLAGLAVALWLFSGRALFAAALASTAMHLAYTLWSATALLRGLKIRNCGCFGALLPRPLGWSTVLEDGALVALSLLLAAIARRKR